MDQLSKNTVSAKNQLKNNDFVKFFNADNSGLRIMFLGNSITLHGVKRDIGWHNAWGMAASAEENDYVHILMRYVQKTNPDASFCICQGAEWEFHYKEEIDFYERFAAARDFNADVIVIRIIENCKAKDFDGVKFKNELMHFLNYLSNGKNTKFIFTTSFWRHPGDSSIEELAKETNCPLIKLGDLGDTNEMMAIGLFEHEGVSIHPGDKGMQCIADRIYSALKDII